MARNIVTPKGKWAKVYGIPELSANVSDLINRTNGLELKREVFMPAAEGLARVARGNAKWNHVKTAIFTAYGDPRKPNVLVGVNYKKAPDAYWLEYGTYIRDARYPKKHKYLKFTIGGRTIFATSVANLKPQPFMRKAVMESRASVIAVLADGMERFIERYGNSFPDTEAA